ncbi:hypothetical protein RJ641_031214 [Dillenia turbinata]|uniref:Uncharacterized protein n=1 Tax=Dillenia turbinata TaxID=194707 RepID=A0AAN8VXP3_9MAGN
MDDTRSRISKFSKILSLWSQKTGKSSQYSFSGYQPAAAVAAYPGGGGGVLVGLSPKCV